LVQVPALILFASLVAVTNYRIHFVSFCQEEQRMGSKTAIGHYLRERGTDTYTYLIGLYFKTPTIQFFAPGTRGEYIREPEVFLQEKKKNLAGQTIIITPEQKRWVPRVTEMYPEAKLEIKHNDQGSVMFYAFEFPEEL